MQLLVTARACDRSRSRSWQKTVGLFGAVLLAQGCAVSADIAGGPSLDSSGAVGGEAIVRGTIEGAGEAGPTARFYAALGAGGGYLGDADAGYGLITPELGLGYGAEHRFFAGFFYAARFVDLADGLDVSNGGGVSVSFLARVARLGGEDSSLMLGPRLTAESIGAPGGDDAIGLFTAALVVRWVFIDTTGNPGFLQGDHVPIDD